MWAGRRHAILTAFAIASAVATASLAAGCGRYGYDGARLVDGDGGIDDGMDPVTDGGVVGCELPFSTPVRVDALSQTGVDDWAPFLAGDGRSIYFASWRSGASDLYLATRNRFGDSFRTPVLLGDVSSSAYETSPATSPDASAIYFVGPSAQDITVFDFFVADRGFGGGGYRAPVREDVLSSAQHDTAIEISRDGLQAFVVSNRPGGAGGRDIWLAERRRTIDEFDPPQPLAELDSADDESSTSLSADGLEIIFSSNRPGGAGGLDLWHARRARTDLPFDPPTRLAELSSSHDDSRPSLSADGTTIYFNYASNEEGGDDADIWVATRCLP